MALKSVINSKETRRCVPSIVVLLKIRIYSCSFLPTPHAISINANFASWYRHVCVVIAKFVYYQIRKEEKGDESMTTQNLTGQISIVEPIVHLVEKNVSFLCGFNLNLYKKLIVKCQVYWRRMKELNRDGTIDLIIPVRNSSRDL